MPYRVLSRMRFLLVATLTLAVFPACAQPGRSSRAGAPATATPAQTLYGTLRSISTSDLALDTGDEIVSVLIQPGTKYLSTMDKVKPSDFEAGDHVTVDATRDDSGHYHASAITMNKKGTAEDKRKAKEDAVRSEKPATAEMAKPAANDSAASERPHLNRVNADAPNTTDQPVANTSKGSEPSITPTVASRRPVSPQPATSDDAAPPVLRRSAPAPSDSSPAPQNGPPRPSLSADDVNGVTRPPTVPPPSAAGANGEMRISPNDDDVIDQTREVAYSFTESLPNYTVKQLTTRYHSESASRGRTSWQPLDLVTADVVYLNGKENYLNVAVNGRPTRDASQNGSWSEGEFASSLQALLSPYSATDFRNKRQSTIVNRSAYKYDYSIEQPHSAWRIQTEGQTYQPAYTGSIWIDKETFRVLRIEMAARNMPRWFPIDTTESSIDYDFVLIGDKKYLLPVHSESLSCWRGTAQCSRNVIEFRNYKKYTADSSITFDSTVPEK